LLDAETAKLIERGVVALERIAEHLAPINETRERQPATLGNAKYSREEKDREEFRKAFGSKESKPKG
jgi:hypothetical protein